ncbi:hypothetical protein J6590_021248 [Homalodisca vitripennis]|nr:hypothetical protein J6590_021248 [Homalodisca vitripennis]
MPATAMFSNLKSRVGGGGGGGAAQNVLDHNPITQYFEIGKVVASAGPEHVWKIHDAYRKSDGKVTQVEANPGERQHVGRQWVDVYADLSVMPMLFRAHFETNSAAKLFPEEQSGILILCSSEPI